MMLHRPVETTPIQVQYDRRTDTKRITLSAIAGEVSMLKPIA